MYTLNDLLILGSNHESIDNVNSLPRDYRLGKTEFVIELTLYRGDTGFVYLGRDSVRNHNVVIKEFFPLNEFKYENEILSFKRDSTMDVIVAKSNENKEKLFDKLKNIYIEEAKYFKKVFTEKITSRVMDTVSINNTSYVILEYIPYPTLNTLLKNYELTPRETSFIFNQILHSVNCIHQNGFTHKELKPTNIYVTDSSVILGDFSFSNQFRPLVTSHSSIYTNIFTAPELFDLDEPHHQSSDIYSLGKLLEYIRDAIGCHKNNKLSNEANKNFKAEKVEFIINNATKISPKERIESVYEMMSLLQTRVESKKKKSKLFALSFTGLIILFVSMIGIVAILPFFSFKLEEKEKTDLNKVRVQVNEPITFVKGNYIFGFEESKIISWENSSESSYYEIQIKYKDEASYLLNTLKVKEKKLDLDLLSLNPGSYTLTVSDSLDKKEVELNFTILNDENISNKEKSVFYYDQYSFYDYESQIIEWTNYDAMYTNMKIVNLNDMAIIGDSIIEQNFVDLKIFNLKPGDYLISVQNIEDDIESYYDRAYISIESEYGIKKPMLYIKNNIELFQEDIIEWVATGTPVEIEIVDVETEEVLYLTTSESFNYISLSDINLSAGIYDIAIYYECEKGYSDVVVKRFTLLK